MQLLFGTLAHGQQPILDRLVNDFSEYEWQVSVAKNALNQASDPAVAAESDRLNRIGRGTAEEIILIGQERDDAALEARGLIRLAYTLALEGQPQEKWRRLTDRALSLGGNYIHSVANVECLMYSGHVFGMVQEDSLLSRKGRRNLEEAIRIATELKDDVLLTRSLNFLAEVLLAQEQIHLARDYAVRGMIVAESTGDDALLKVALTALIVVCRHQHGIDSVMPYARRLREIAPDSVIAKSAIEHFECSPNLISSYQEAIEVSLRCDSSVPVTEEIARYQLTLGEIFHRSGDHKKAIEYYSQGLESFQSIGDTRSSASCALPIAELKIGMGEEVEKLLELESYAPSPSSLQQSLKFAEQMGRIFFAAKNYEKAAEWQGKSLEFYQRLSVRELANSKTSGDDFWDVELKYREAKLAQYNQQRKNQFFYLTLGGLAVLFVSLAVIGWAQYRTVKKSNSKLEHLVEERTRSLSTAYEKAELATHSKSEFLAKVNHDIRNPLTAIIGYCDLLRFIADSGDMNAEQTEQYVSGITTSSKHLLKLVEDVLDISKIEQGQVTISNDWFCLQEMCTDIEKMVSEQVNQSQLHFQIYCGFDQGDVFSDEVRIKQIILNLINNAIKFTERGFVLVELHYQEDASVLNIDVSDSGNGIADTFQDTIFEPFFQCPDEGSNTGTGLGLNIVSSLVDALGGSVQYESQESVGTTFRVCLPVGSANDVTFTRETSLQSQRDFKILVVDDKPVVRDAICKQLQIQGCTTEMADTIQSTMKIIESWRPDFVFLDLRMPGKSGFDFLEAIRDSASYHPLCIAVTGDATNEVKARCRVSGFDGFLAKPICNSKLISLFEKSRIES